MYIHVYTRCFKCAPQSMQTYVEAMFEQCVSGCLFVTHYTTVTTFCAGRSKQSSSVFLSVCIISSPSVLCMVTCCLCV